MSLAPPASLFVAFLTLASIASAMEQTAPASSEADAILKEVATATRAAMTLSAEVTLTRSDGGAVTTTTGKVNLKKPNFARIELGNPPQLTIASDGKSVWFVQLDRMRYQKYDAKPNGSQIASLAMVPVAMFFDPDSRGFPDASVKTVRFAGNETIGGEPFRVVEITGEQPHEFTLKCYAASSGLVTRTSLSLKSGEKIVTLDSILSNVKINDELPDDSFAYAPPKLAARADLADPDDKLVPVGEKAYRFSVRAPDGSRLTFDGVSKGKKAIFVSFWYYGCTPSRRQFPALQKLYDELKDKGFEVIALNVDDSSDLITHYLAAKKLTFKVGMCTQDDPVWKEFRATTCPTNYLLDSDGKVIWRQAAFDEAEIRKSLKKLGIE